MGNSTLRPVRRPRSRVSLRLRVPSLRMPMAEVSLAASRLVVLALVALLASEDKASEYVASEDVASASDLDLASAFPVAVASVVSVEANSAKSSADTPPVDLVATTLRSVAILRLVVNTKANLTAVPTITSTDNGEQVAETLKVPGISGSLTD